MMKNDFCSDAHGRSVVCAINPSGGNNPKQEAYTHGSRKIKCSHDEARLRKLFPRCKIPLSACFVFFLFVFYTFKKNGALLPPVSPVLVS